MAAKDELFKQLMQNHNANQTPGDVMQQSMQSAQQPQETDNWQNPNKFKENPIAKSLYEGLTQTKPGAAFLGVGEGVHQHLQSVMNLFRSPENQMGSLGTEDLINPEHGAYHSGGKLGGNLLADYLGLKGIGTAMRGATGIGGLVSRMGASAGYNYATGEHFPEELGGRMGSAAVGAAFPVTAGATASEVGKNIITGAENAEARYGGRIGEILSQANPIRPRYTHAMQDLVNGTHNVGQEYGITELLTDFLTNPSAQSAQDAMSVMKRAQREMLNFTHPRVSHLPEASQRAYRALGDGIQSLENQIERSLSPEAFRQYREALRDYAGNAAPYAQPAIRGARSGTGPAKNIPKALERMEKHSQTLPGEFGEDALNQFRYLMQQHPELYANKVLRKIAPWATGAGVTGVIGNEALDRFVNITSSHGEN